MYSYFAGIRGKNFHHGDTEITEKPIWGKHLSLIECVRLSI